MHLQFWVICDVGGIGERFFFGGKFGGLSDCPFWLSWYFSGVSIIQKFRDFSKKIRQISSLSNGHQNKNFLMILTMQSLIYNFVLIFCIYFRICVEYIFSLKPYHLPYNLIYMQSCEKRSYEIIEIRLSVNCTRSNFSRLILEEHLIYYSFWECCCFGKMLSDMNHK